MTDPDEDLGKKYLERMREPRLLTPEDEDMLADLLGLGNRPICPLVDPL